MVKKLGSRKRADYDSQVHGGRSSLIPDDDCSINTKVAAVRLIRPNWHKGPLIFRVMPCLSYEEVSELVQGRSGREPSQYEHFFVRCDMASYVGINNAKPRSWILYPPYADEETKNNNPYRVFYNAIKRAYDNGEFGNGCAWDGKWNKLMKGKKDEGAEIERWKAQYFAFAAVYANGDKTYVDAEHPAPLGLGAKDELCIVQMRGTAGEGMRDLFNQEKEEYDDAKAEKDFSEPFYWGDPTGIPNPKTGGVDGGLFVKIFNPKISKITTDLKVRKYMASAWDGKIKINQGYEAAIYNKLPLNGQWYYPSLTKAEAELHRSKLRFWFDSDSGPKHLQKGLLRIEPNEVQALWVAQAFKDVPQLVSWAFSEHDEYMTEDVKGVLRSRVSAVVPGKDADESEGTTRSSGKVRRDTTVSDDPADPDAELETPAEDEPLPDDEAASELAEPEVDEADDDENGAAGDIDAQVEPEAEADDGEVDEFAQQVLAEEEEEEEEDDAAEDAAAAEAMEGGIAGDPSDSEDPVDEADEESEAEEPEVEEPEEEAVEPEPGPAAAKNNPKSRTPKKPVAAQPVEDQEDDGEGPDMDPPDEEIPVDETPEPPKARVTPKPAAKPAPTAKPAPAAKAGTKKAKDTSDEGFFGDKPASSRVQQAAKQAEQRSANRAPPTTAAPVVSKGGTAKRK